MKWPFWIFFFLTLVPSRLLLGQRRLADSNLLPFGKINHLDLSMTVCPFDSSAGAEYLIDQRALSFDSKAVGMDNIVFVLKEENHERIKIFNQGQVGLGNVKIPIYIQDNQQQVEGVKAETFNLDEQGHIQISEVGKKSIYVQKVDRNHSEIAFSLPNVKPGSVIEYEYTKYDLNIENIPTWFFQSGLPSRYSWFQVKIPSRFNYVFENMVSLPFSVDTAQSYIQDYIGGTELSGTQHTWAMKDIPALHEEPFMTTPEDYLQRVEFQLSSMKHNGVVQNVLSTWPQVVDALMNDPDFGQQLNKGIPEARDFIKEVSQLKDKLARMYQVYNYVRSNMSWNGTNELFARDNINKVWDLRTGSSGEINLILIDLLKQVGLDAFPLLVSTRDHGRINLSYPFVDQFNETVAYIWLNGRPYILDGTEKTLPYNLVPLDILNTSGYLVNPDLRGWVQINDRYFQFKNEVAVLASITSGRILKGTAYISSFDYSRDERLNKWKEGEKGFEKEYFTKGNSAVRIDSLGVRNLGNDSLPLLQTAQFRMPLNHSGNYLFFNANLFTGLDQDPFISKQRFSDVDFGYNQTYTMQGVFSIPEGYRLEVPPHNLELIMPDTSIIFQRIIAYDTHTLSVRFGLYFRQPFFPRSEYPALQGFYKQLFDRLNEQIVLVRND